MFVMHTLRKLKPPGYAIHPRIGIGSNKNFLGLFSIKLHQGSILVVFVISARKAVDQNFLRHSQMAAKQQWKNKKKKAFKSKAADTMVSNGKRSFTHN